MLKRRQFLFLSLLSDLSAGSDGEVKRTFASRLPIHIEGDVATIHAHDQGLANRSQAAETEQNALPQTPSTTVYTPMRNPRSPSGAMLDRRCAPWSNPPAQLRDSNKNSMRPKNFVAASVGKSKDVLIDGAGEMVYRIQFKHRIYNHMTSTQLRSTNHRIQIGDYVVVETDRRGVDVGMVVASLPLTQLMHQATLAAAQGDDDYGIIRNGRIIRIAAAYEIQQMAQKYRDETEVVKTSQMLSIKHGLRIEILGAEYQFDRQMLTVFYTSGTRIDFRSMVRDLYARYRARVWMKQLFADDAERVRQKDEFRRFQDRKRAQAQQQAQQQKEHRIQKQAAGTQPFAHPGGQSYVNGPYPIAYGRPDLHKFSQFHSPSPADSCESELGLLSQAFDRFQLHPQQSCGSDLSRSSATDKSGTTGASQSFGTGWHSSSLDTRSSDVLSSAAAHAYQHEVANTHPGHYFREVERS